MIHPHVVFDQSGVRVTQTSESQIVVVTRRRWITILMLAFLCPVIGLCAFGFANVAIAMFRDLPADDLVAWCIPTVVAGMAVLAGLASLLSVLAFCLLLVPRRFILDADARRCSFRGAFGLGGEFSFDDVESVTLCTGRREGWYLCWVCFAIRGRDRFLGIHAISRQRGPEDALITELRPVAEALSRVTDRPLETRENVSVWRMSWR